MAAPAAGEGPVGGGAGGAGQGPAGTAGAAAALSEAQAARAQAAQAEAAARSRGEQAAATAELSENISPEAAAELGEANARYRDYKETYSRGPVGDVLRTGEREIPDSQVPRKFFAAGGTTPEHVAQYIKAVGGREEGMRAAREYLVHEMRQKGVITPAGEIDLKEFPKWLARREPAIRALGGELPEQMLRAAQAQRTVEAVSAENARRIEAVRKSAAAHFLNDADPVRAFGKLVTASERPDGHREIANLLRLVRRDPNALEGLRRAGVDYVLGRFQGAQPSGEGDFLKAAQFRAFVEGHKRLLRALYGGQGLQTFDAVASDLRRAARRTSATAGSDTAANQARASASGKGVHGHGGVTTGLTALLGEHLGEQVGRLLGHGVVGGAVGAVSPVLAGAMRQRALSTVHDLVREAMLHPEVARELLQRFGPNSRPGPVYWRRLAARLLQGGAVADPGQPSRPDNAE